MGATILLLTLGFSHRAFAVIPSNGTWEAWILRMRRPDLAKLLSPMRPDKKKFADPLPLWVDCHLSWVADHPKLGKTQKLLDGVVLRSSSRKCRGQIEQWAR